MRMRVLTILFAVVMVGILGTRSALTQDDPAEVCSTFIEEAIRVVGDNCGLLDRNSACYGYQRINATFTESQPAEFFSTPNARSPLAVISSLVTSPLRTAINEWGIALLSVQANLPETLPGQSVIFMLLGDTEVENAVEPVDVYQPGAILSITTSADADLRYQARPDADLLASVPAGTPLQADAISEDGAFVRVVYQGTPGWIPTGALTGGVDLAPLAIITPDTRTPGQAFYLRTRIGQTECVEAPDSLLVQSPQGLKVDLNANGAEIRVGSTVVLRTIPVTPEDAAALRLRFNLTEEVVALLELTTLDGEAEVEPDTPASEFVRTGQRAYRCLKAADDLATEGDADDNAIIADCPWFNFTDLTPVELGEFGGFDGIVLNYPVEIPESTPTATPESDATATATPTRTPRPPDFPIITNTPRPTATPTSFITNTPVTPTNTVPVEPPTATFTLTPTLPGCPTSIPTPVTTPDELVCAVLIANANPGLDTITLVNKATFIYSTPYSPDQALPTITDALILNGEGSSLVRQDGAPTMRFIVLGDNISLQLNSLNMVNGSPTGSGGAIYSNGLLTLSGGNFSSNSAPSGAGGAIYHDGLSLTVIGSSFNTNIAATQGGAIAVEPPSGGSFDIAADGPSFFISDSAFSNNSAAEGGGVYGRVGGAITASTFRVNSATDGGGFKNCADGLTWNVERSALIGNMATNGGGAFNCAGAFLNLLNSTVSGNSGSGVDNRGGAHIAFTTIYGNSTFGVDTSGGASLELRHTILAANDTACGGAPTTSGAVFATDNTCGVPLVALEALEINSSADENGGTTPNHALGANSAAIASATCFQFAGTPEEIAVTVDQRGVSRPRPVGTLCDAGSFEDVESTGPLPTPTFTHTFTPTVTPSNTPTHTATFTSTPTLTPTHTATFTPTFTATFTSTFTPTFTATFTPTFTITPSNTATFTPTFTATFTPTFTITPSNTPTFTPTPTMTPTPTVTPIPGCAPAIPNPAATVSELICAIELANDEVNYPGPNTINLPADADFTFLSAYAPGQALPTITSVITITGSSNGLGADSGLFGVRAFVVGPTGSLTMSGVTLSGWSGAGNGGAILSTGILSLTNVSVQSNQTSGKGGGIHQTGGKFSMVSSNVNFNNAADNGGGIYITDSAANSATIEDSFINGNNAVQGGGVYVGGEMSLSLDNTVMEFNSANVSGPSQNFGGAIFSTGRGTLTLAFSTINTNGASNAGGGLYIENTLSMNHTTVTLNNAQNLATNIVVCGTGLNHTITVSTIDNGTSSESAAGIRVCAGATLNLSNSTVSSNDNIGIEAFGPLNLHFTTIAFNDSAGVARLGAGTFSARNALLVANGSANCFGAPTTVSGVSASSDTTCGIGPNMLVQGTGAIALGPLQNNGGVTRTHYVSDASTVRNVVPLAQCDLTTDQRAVPRPSGVACEPGSVENNTAGGGGGADFGAALLPDATETPTPTVTPTMTPSETPVVMEPTPTLFDPSLIEIIPESTAEATVEIIIPPTAFPTIAPSATPTATPPVEATPEATPEATDDPTPSVETTDEPATSSLKAVPRALDYAAWFVRP